MIEKALERLAKEIVRLKEVEMSYPETPISSVERFCFAPDFFWPAGTGLGLFYILENGREISLGDSRNWGEIARRLAERGKEELILREIERAIEWCRKKEEELKERKREIFEEQREAIEQIRARACLQVLVSRERRERIEGEGEDFYGLCEKVIAYALQELEEEIYSLPERGERKVFQLAPGITWIGGKNFWVNDGNLEICLKKNWDRRLLVRRLIRETGGEPRKILEVLQKLEEVIRWIFEVKKGGR